jgi:hypothetical protein
MERSGVLELELVVVVVRLGSKADFFDDYFHRLGCDFLLLLLLIVQEFLVVDDFADGGISILGDHHQVELVSFGHGLGFARTDDNGFLPFPHQADSRHTNVLVNLVGGFRFTVATSLAGSRRSIVPQRGQVLNLSL